MLRDVESFNVRLGKIDGFDEVGDSLLNIVKAKEIKAPATPPPPAAAAATTAAETEEKKGEKEPEEEAKDGPAARDSEESKESKAEDDEQDGVRDDKGGAEPIMSQS